MEIVIAKNWKGKIIAIVASRSKELATAYFHGAGIQYNTVETLAELKIGQALNESVSGVINILSTSELRIKGEVSAGAVIVK
jgi:hypothetical protein